MQKQQNKKLVPKLRFKEFEGEWRSLYFKEIFKFVRSNSFSRNDMSAENGTILNIHYGDIHTKYKTNFDLTNEVVPSINPNIHLNLVDSDYLKEGDLVIADASEDYKDIGKTIEIINLDNKNVVSGLHTIAARPINISQGFYGNLFKTYGIRKQLMRIANGISVLGISKSNLEGIEVIIPTYEEQHKIASFLTAVDKRIEQLTKKKKLLEEYKKGVMQKIFNQEIRFKDENGNDFPDWEEKRLGELTSKVSKKNSNSKKLPIYSINNVSGFLPQGEQFEGIDSGSRNYDISMYKIVNKEMFAYNPARINVGSLGYSGELDNIIVSSLYVIFTTDKSFDDHYALQLFKTEKFNNLVNRYAEGGVRQYLFYGNFASIKIPLPSVYEQKEIRSFLSQIDNAYQRTKEVLDLNATYKQALLQQMFI